MRESWEADRRVGVDGALRGAGGRGGGGGGRSGENRYVHIL